MAKEHVNDESTHYAVFRSGIRVSEQTYQNEFDAHIEADHWNKIIKKWPDGTQISVEPVNRKARRH
jgi:hypothetical protein